MALIRKYPDLTTPTPAYNGKVRTCFSPKAWKHFLVAEDGTLEELDGVTSVLKKAVDKSQPLMRWATTLALARARALLLKTGIGGDGAIQIFVDELDKILAEAKKADADALEDAGEVGHQAHDFIDRICKSVVAQDDKRLEEVLCNFPDEPRACNGAIAALDFFIQHNIRIVKSEFRCLSLKHKACGTGDLLAYVDSCGGDCCPEPFTNRLSYIDFKTSNYLYSTYLLQAAFYCQAIEEEFPELPVEDRWILRLDKENAEFDAWHAAGSDAQAEDLNGFLCCLNVVRALAVTEKRMAIIVDARKALAAVRKAEEKLERDRIACPKSSDYKGSRLTKCLADGTQCEACSRKYQEKHAENTKLSKSEIREVGSPTGFGETE
jgi:hypothetical protein